MNNKLVIWGWWQGNNLGDNWIKKTMKDLFPQAQFAGTDVQTFKKGNFVICGGGGLFVHDVIPPWTMPPRNVKFGMLGIGAEFPHSCRNAVRLYEQSEFFYVRDQYSLDCMHLSDIERSYDITFAAPLPFSEISENDDDKILFVWRDDRELSLNKEFSEYIQSNGKDFYNTWRSSIDNHFSNVIEDDFQTQDDNVEDHILDCGFVISGRYHGIVMAIQRGLPFIAIDICPKIRALLEECGLEEFCIKISEVDRIDYLIDKARKEIDNIRAKELFFVETANRVLLKQITHVKYEILKYLRPLKVLHYGSYWMGENDVVYAMADDLSKLCKLKRIDLRIYSGFPSRKIASNIDTENGKLCILDRKKVLREVKKNKADAIILNSGGLYLDDIAFSELKKRKVHTIGISLSDPDVFPFNGKVYAEKFDVFYTNSKYSLLHDYPETGANAKLLPFAASNGHHYYMPDIERKYDVVVVAHAREERLPVIKKLETICKVGAYGSGWENSLGEVNGIEHVKAINSGKMYVSFSRTMAGYENVKVGVFEAMACNQVVITSYMEELKDYFEIGSEIICYKTEDELYEIVEYYLTHEEEREAVRHRGYRRFLRDHTYEKRWDAVLMNLYKEMDLL